VQMALNVGEIICRKNSCVEGSPRGSVQQGMQCAAK